MGLSVDQDDGVRRYLWVLCFQVILDGVVEFFRGRLFNDDRLGQRLRMRLRQLERREECFRRRRLELEKYAGARVWRR